MTTGRGCSKSGSRWSSSPKETASASASRTARCSSASDEWPGGKNLATSPKLWRRLFGDIGSANLGLNYDPSHMIWQQMDYLQPMREFKDRLFHVHAKDVRIDRERLDDVGILAHPSEYHTPKLPGMGDVNWGQFFSVLTDVGYRGPRLRRSRRPRLRRFARRPQGQPAAEPHVPAELRAGLSRFREQRLAEHFDQHRALTGRRQNPTEPPAATECLRLRDPHFQRRRRPPRGAVSSGALLKRRTKGQMHDSQRGRPPGISARSMA